MSLILTILGGIVLILVIIWLFLKVQIWRHQKYFQSRNVPFMYDDSTSFFKILTGQLSIIDLELAVYRAALKAEGESSSGCRGFVGFIFSATKPCYYVMDLDLIKHIFVKDFDHFVDRRHLLNQGSPTVFKKMLPNMESEEWKAMRSKVSPLFTTGKIKRMFAIFDKSIQRMNDYLEDHLGNGGMEVNFCELYSKFAMDVIASCAFGVDSKCFDNPLGAFSEFEKMGQKLQFKLSVSFIIKLIATTSVPKLTEKLGIQVLDAEPQNYFRSVIKKVIKHRRETKQRQDDFLQLLMDTQDGLLESEESSKETLEVFSGTGNSEDNALIRPVTKSEKLKYFDDESIVANCVVFLTGGFDTLQSLLLWATYLLAIHPEVQKKLAKEVRASLDGNDGKFTYDIIHQMSYLDRVINETLRYYSPATRLERECTKDYVIPNTDVVIQKGQVVIFPVLGVHRDAKYYENPDHFDPDRFSPEERSKRHPFAFSPFGQGPRNCIAMRFALTEAKAVIAGLISRFELEPCSKTSIPPKFGNSPIVKPAGDEIWLKVKLRSTN